MTPVLRRVPSGVVLGLIGGLLVVEGLVAIRIGYPSFDFRNAMFALLTGWVVGGVGLAAWYRRPDSRTGLLLVAAAAAWYVGGLRWVAFEPIAAAAAGLDLVFAAVVAHAVLTYPTGRSATTAVRALVVTAYAASIVPAPRADVLVAAVLLLGLAGGWLGDASARRERTFVTIAGIMFALVLGGYRLVPPLVGGLGWLDTRPILQVALVFTSLTLAWPLARSRPRAERVADVVVELATDADTDLARQLGNLMGDPSVRLGFWDAGQMQYVDAQGRPLAFSSEADRMLSVIEVDGRVMAAVEHARSLSLDGRTRAALARAVALASANALLQAEVRDQVAEVRASRRRLLLTSDEERMRLEQELFETLDPRFDAIEVMLSDTRLGEKEPARLALDQVRQTRVEMASLIRGWGPAVLDERGITGALSDLATRAKVPVALHLAEVEIPSRVTSAALVFVASEALANVAKHADAGAVTLRLTRTGRDVQLEVDDDGRGGADASTGTGLQGLRDRIEAIGGRFFVESRPGRGTRLFAILPLEDAGT